MTGWRDRLPGARIRDEIRWLRNRVEWTEEAAAEERWLRERSDPVLSALEEQVLEAARRVLADKEQR